MQKYSSMLLFFVIASCNNKDTRYDKFRLTETNFRGIDFQNCYLLRRDSLLDNRDSFYIINEQVYLNDKLTSYGKGKYVVKFSNQAISTINYVKDFDGHIIDTLRDLFLIKKDTSWEVLSNYKKYPPSDLLELKSYENKVRKIGDKWELLQELKINPAYKNKYIYDTDFNIIEIEYYRNNFMFKFRTS